MGQRVRSVEDAAAVRNRNKGAVHTPAGVTQQLGVAHGDAADGEGRRNCRRQRLRAKLLVGGELTIESRPDAGTTIRLDVPT